MSRVSRVVVVAVIFLLCSCAAEKVVYTPQEYGAGSVAAVWELEDLSVTTNSTLADIQEFMTDAVMETLKDRGQFELVERQRLLLALEELNLGSSELAAESSRLRVGQIIGAQLMVFGAYQLVGSQLRVDLRMVEVESGAVVKAAEYTSNAADIAGWLKAAENAALQLVGGGGEGEN